MTDAIQTQAPVAGRITIDDVRNALDGANPNQTHAGKVRALLGGRGSQETIQKHLNTLRAELAAAAVPPVSADAIPALPTEVGQAIWFAAWTAAQVQTLARSEKLATERDAALLKLETMSQDVAGLVSTVDEQAASLDQAAVTVATVQALHLVDVDRLKADHLVTVGKWEAEQKELEHARQKITKVQANAEHAAQMAEAGRELLRQELARLTDQIGELKAALYDRANASPAVVTPTTTTPSPAGK